MRRDGEAPFLRSLGGGRDEDAPRLEGYTFPSLRGSRRFRGLRAGRDDAEPEAPLERFSLRTAAPEVRAGWRALELPAPLAALVYGFQRLRYSRAGRIALTTVVLTPILVMASLMFAGFDEVTRLVKRAQTEHTTFMSRPDTLILVLGTDDIPTKASRARPGRSDTMMLVNVQYDRQRIRVLSIPRDTFVMIDYGKGARGDKIAHAFRRGGLQKSLEAVRRLTGLQVDHFVTIDYGLFRTFIDEIDGVPLEIEKRMFYEDKAGGLLIDFQPGLQVLTGQKALEYVRFRKDGKGDIGRIERQQKFLRALVTKLLDVRVLQGLLNERTISKFLAHLETSFDPSQVLPLGLRFFKVGPEAFAARVLPGRHAFRRTPWTGGKRLSYFFPDWGETEGLVDDWLLATGQDEGAPGEAEGAAPAPPPKPRRVRLDPEVRAADQALQQRILDAPEGIASLIEDVDPEDPPEDDG